MNNEERNWCVYCHTNKISGKKYIGITGGDVNRRWQNGVGYRGSSYFYRAILKYGWDGFKHEILFGGLTESEAKLKEIELISLCKTNERTFGYNLTNGGEGTTGLKMSDESKEKMRMARFGKYKGENHPMYGKKLSEETKEKIRISSLKKTRECIDLVTEKISKKVVQLDKDGNYIQTWKSINEAGRNLKILPTTICSCCKNKQCFSGGYLWIYMEDYEKMDKEQILELIKNKKRHKNSISVVQLDINGNFIKEWNSAKDAGRHIGHFDTSITSCCKNKLKTAYGYIWIYKDEYENTKNKITKEQIENKLLNKNCIKVVQLDKFGDVVKIWDSIKKASDYNNVSTTSINYCCKNRNNHTCGSVWMYESEYNKLDKNKISYICNEKLSNLNQRVKKEVVMLSMEYKFIEKFTKANECKKYGFRPDRILDCCENKIKTHKGYKWMYYDDYKNNSIDNGLNI